MDQKETDRKRLDFNAIIGLVLRSGVVASCLIIALGSLLLFLEHQTGYYSLGTPEQLSGSQNRSLIGVAPLVQGVIGGRPFAIIELGLVVLLATPVVRVAISIPLFLGEGRMAFAVITATVLAILLFSMFVVAPALST